jgi:hypothetical protein
VHFLAENLATYCVCGPRGRGYRITSAPPAHARPVPQNIPKPERGGGIFPEGCYPVKQLQRRCIQTAKAPPPPPVMDPDLTLAALEERGVRAGGGVNACNGLVNT